MIRSENDFKNACVGGFSEEIIIPQLLESSRFH